MVVALLYAMQSPCNCFTLSLRGSDGHGGNSWHDGNDASMEIKCQASDDGDHDGALEMEIKGTR